MKPKFSITLFASTIAGIDARGDNRSETIGRDLERYYAALERARKSINLTPGECGLILDVCNGTIFEPWSLPALAVSVEYSANDGYGEKWGCGVGELAEKLRQMSYIENAAIIDAAERWWERVSRGEQPNPAELLK